MLQPGDKALAVGQCEARWQASHRDKASKGLTSGGGWAQCSQVQLFTYIQMKDA